MASLQDTVGISLAHIQDMSVEAAQELTSDVNAELSSGWEPQGGIASIQAGTSVYLIQALARRR